MGRRRPGRPRIGVSVSRRTAWRVYPFFWWALRRAGAVPIKITVGRRRNSLAGLDAVVIGGGDDVGIELYGGELREYATFDKERDKLELDLIEEAEDRCLPMLGVCRGAQLINVARGGTLHEDIYETYPEAKPIHTPLPRKTVRVAPGSRLAETIGPEPSEVNALHRQSVDLVGAGLRPVAWDEAGIVQAIECRRGPRYVIGVQWHPEYLVFSKRDWRLFRALVANAVRPEVVAESDTAVHPGEPPPAPEAKPGEA